MPDPPLPGCPDWPTLPSIVSHPFPAGLGPGRCASEGGWVTHRHGRDCLSLTHGRAGAPRIVSAGSGSAVAQQAHSAITRPTTQLLRPQPGQTVWPPWYSA